MHDHDLVCDELHESQIVLDDDKGHGLGQPPQEPRRSDLLLLRHAGAGLVEKQDPGTGREHHGDLQPLALAVTQLVGYPVS